METNDKARKWNTVTEQMPENFKECNVKGFSSSGKPKQGTAFYHPVIGWFGSFNGRVAEWQYIKED